MKRTLSVAFMIVIFVALALPSGAAPVPESVTVEIESQAMLLDGGQYAEVQVAVACHPRSIVLEAFVYLVQDGNQSLFAGIPVTCRHRPRDYSVRVAASPDQPFHPGEATASAYVLVYDRATGTTMSGGDTQQIEIR